MARPDKAAAVAELTEEFRSSNAAVLTEYRGLTVAQLKELRRSLGADTSYAVVKNTLTKIAAKDAGVAAFDELLVGPSAIAFVKGDPVEAAKGLRDFAKAHPHLVIKGGVLDGKSLTPAELTKLADLESREVLLAKMAGALQASLTNAVSLFAAPLAQTARVIEALRQKAEQDPSVLRGGGGADQTAESVAAEPEVEAEEPTAPEVAAEEATPEVAAEDSTTTEAAAEETTEG
jgi:large subunit ribosomal protein L10